MSRFSSWSITPKPGSLSVLEGAEIWIKMERAIPPISVTYRIYSALALLSVTQKGIRQSDHAKALDLGTETNAVTPSRTDSREKWPSLTCPAELQMVVEECWKKPWHPLEELFLGASGNSEDCCTLRSFRKRKNGKSSRTTLSFAEVSVLGHLSHGIT